MILLMNEIILYRSALNLIHLHGGSKLRDFGQMNYYTFFRWIKTGSDPCCTSVRHRRIAFFLNLGLLELSYRFLVIPVVVRYDNNQTVIQQIYLKFCFDFYTFTFF